MTAHRTTPDPFGVSLWVGDVSSDAPLPLVLNGMADGTIIEPAGRVPLAQAVAGDEYVVVKRAVIDRVRAHCQFVTEAGAATMYQGGAYDVATEVLTALDGER